MCLNLLDFSSSCTSNDKASFCRVFAAREALVTTVWPQDERNVHMEQRTRKLMVHSSDHLERVYERAHIVFGRKLNFDCN